MTAKGGLTPTCLHGDGRNNAVAHLKAGINWKGERGRISLPLFLVVSTVA